MQQVRPTLPDAPGAAACCGASAAQSGARPGVCAGGYLPLRCRSRCSQRGLAACLRRNTLGRTGGQCSAARPGLVDSARGSAARLSGARARASGSARSRTCRPWRPASTRASGATRCSRRRPGYARWTAAPCGRCAAAGTAARRTGPRQSPGGACPCRLRAPAAARGALPAAAAGGPARGPALLGRTCCTAGQRGARGGWPAPRLLVAPGGQHHTPAQLAWPAPAAADAPAPRQVLDRAFVAAVVLLGAFWAAAIAQPGVLRNRPQPPSVDEARAPHPPCPRVAAGQATLPQRPLSAHQAQQSSLLVARPAARGVHGGGR